MQMGMLWDTINCGLFFFCFNRHDRWNKKMEKMCISYSKRSRIEKKEVNRSNSFCCIASARIPFWMDGWMMSNTIVFDLMLAAKATNNSAQDGLMPQPCCYVTKHCEPGKLYRGQWVWFFLHNPGYGTTTTNIYCRFLRLRQWDMVIDDSNILPNTLEPPTYFS